MVELPLNSNFFDTQVIFLIIETGWIKRGIGLNLLVSGEFPLIKEILNKKINCGRLWLEIRDYFLCVSTQYC